MKVTFVFILGLVGGCCSSPILDSWMNNAKEGTKTEGGNIWAVLVAGSAGYSNYRHQADVCHLYQLLTKKHGISPQHVIVMMMNDIAYNRRNKTPGIIVNALHGKDVYEGTIIDYMQRDVTPKNFLMILQGLRMGVGSMKTLGSGPNDYVFVNFVDHGDTGVLGFPNGELHLEDLQSTLNIMHQSGKYKQMLWYVEACFSGSMFESLSPNMNITAHTAANAYESSWACVFDQHRMVYLGDCWSLNWLNNTEQIYPRLYLETVEEQYEVVRNMTTTSHAMVYGDLDIIYHENLSTFMGHSKGEYNNNEAAQMVNHLTDAIPAPDVLLATLRRRREGLYPELDEDLENEILYHEETEKRVQEVLEQIVMKMVKSEEMLAVFQESRQSIGHPGCNKDVLGTFYEACWGMQQHPYITKYTYWISNLCNTYQSSGIVNAILTSCNSNGSQ